MPRTNRATPASVSDDQVSREPMDPELRAQLLDRLSHRAARLAKCTSVSHPAHTIDNVIAMMAGSVARTAMVLLGPAFSREMFDWLFDSTVEDHGICRFCHLRKLREDRTMCQFCWDQAASDDDITDDDLAQVFDEQAAAKDSAAKDSAARSVESQPVGGGAETNTQRIESFPPLPSEKEDHR